MRETMARPILIDCDPGVDDAVALLLAFAHQESLKILGITTVGGNVSLGQVTANALALCDLAGQTHIPIHGGCGRPLVRQHLLTAEHVHGITGLGDAKIPPSLRNSGAQHGVDFLINCLKSHREKVTLVTLGPLTNIAMALVKEPSIKEHIEELIFMGGAIYEGNVNGGQAEFNIYNDPHAAHVVLSSGLKLTMIGLETTSCAQLTPERAQELLALKNPISQVVFDMIKPMHAADSALGKKGGVLHDVCTIAYLLAPQLFKGKECPVSVEMASLSTLGRTIVDFQGKTHEKENVYVTHSLDTSAFFHLLFSALALYPLNNALPHSA